MVRIKGTILTFLILHEPFLKLFLNNIVYNLIIIYYCYIRYIVSNEFHLFTDFTKLSTTL